MTSISLHFIIKGEYITKKIQDFVMEHNMTGANKIMDALIPPATYEQRRALVAGNAKFIGNTLCDDEKCSQCKSLRKNGRFEYVTIPDKVFQKRMKEQQEFLKKYYFEIDGDVNIKKAVVSNLIVKKTTLDLMKEARYKNNDIDRLSNKKLSKQYLDALDDWEIAQNSLYQEYGILRNKEYSVGTREWKAKIEAESIMDIVKAKSVYEPEISELIRECRNTGTITAMASEKLYAVTTRQAEDESLQEKLSEKIERKRPAKISKVTVKIGDFSVPKHLVDDYANAVNISNTSAMVFKAKYGKLNPLVEQKKFQTRIELHQKIFEAMKLPYHQTIDHKKKNLTKKEIQSMDLQEALTEYLESHFD